MGAKFIKWTRYLIAPSQFERDIFEKSAINRANRAQK